MNEVRESSATLLLALILVSRIVSLNSSADKEMMWHFGI